MNVDIYIKERNGTREIRVPLLPEAIECRGGETIFISYDIMNKGGTVTPAGMGLHTYAWKANFPGKYRTDDSLLRGTWQDPSTYHNTLNDWKKNGTALNLLVTGYPINADVYIDTYHSEASGGFGDIPYEISFIEAGQDIIVTDPGTASSTPQRPAAKAATYTIKKGDTLWGIAQKELGKGSMWQKIYDANKTIIEQTAKKYGKSHSNNGWWIYPGVTLTIPR